jgi:hypothetical protein
MAFLVVLDGRQHRGARLRRGTELLAGAPRCDQLDRQSHFSDLAAESEQPLETSLALS